MGKPPWGLCCCLSLCKTVPGINGSRPACLSVIALGHIDFQQARLMLTSGKSFVCRVMKAVDMATSKVKKWQPEAHPAAINALQVLPEGLIASGDDDGCIKLWDTRQAQAQALASFSEHTDFIAEFAYQV